jgi:hypothetical protein
MPVAISAAAEKLELFLFSVIDPLGLIFGNSFG